MGMEPSRNKNGKGRDKELISLIIFTCLQYPAIMSESKCFERGFVQLWGGFLGSPAQGSPSWLAPWRFGFETVVLVEQASQAGSLPGRRQMSEL